MPPSRLTANQIDERIAAAIHENYEDLVFPLIAATLANERERGDSELQLAFRKLESEVAKFEGEIARLRALVFTLKAEQAEKAERAEKGAPVDLPNPLVPLKRTTMN
jgi:hypothetical protein